MDNKEFNSDNLPYPFNVAYKYGHPIHYRCENCKDHEYVESLGYKIKEAGDCTYYANGLQGINLSSYGNWGTFFPMIANQNAIKIFRGLIEQGIAKPFALTVHLPKKDAEKIPPGSSPIDIFTYDTETGWETFSENSFAKKCNDPFKEEGLA